MSDIKAIQLEITEEDIQTIQVDASLFHNYKNAYIQNYIRMKDSYFTIGEKSNKVYFSKRMYMDILRCVKVNPICFDLEEDIMKRNSEMIRGRITFLTWISLDRYIWKSYKVDILKAIHKEYKINFPKEINELTTETHQLNGEEVLLFVHQGTDSLYAVPKEDAVRLQLEDYHHMLIQHNDVLITELEPFKISCISTL